MAASAAELMSRRFTRNRSRYTERDTMLYALSVGLGADPLDQQQLPFVFEKPALKTLPTKATVEARSQPLVRGAGLDMNKVLHGEQRLAIRRPLPPAAELETESSIDAVLDKGPDKGVLIYSSTTAWISGEADPVLVHGNTIFARGDGGIGSFGEALTVHQVPTRAPDRIVRVATRPDQALLYRLNGDNNPLHADPAMAAAAGFPRPILHGLCTYGIACRAVLEGACAFDPERIKTFDVRFSKAVFPGETIATELWIEDNTVSFRCRAEERGVVVLDNGLCKLSS